MTIIERTTVTRSVPAVIDQTGEVIPLDLTVAISVEGAAARLLAIQRVFRELRRLEGFLTQVLTTEIQGVEGRTELRIGDTVFELKGDAEWQITEPNALYLLLTAAADKGDITSEELDAAVRLEENVKANHAKLNALTKRLPDIDRYRTRTETPPKLRTRSK